MVGEKVKMTRMMMKVWMIIIVSMWVSANVEGTDHNHDAHNALCDLLSVSVKKWGEVKDRKHDDPLRKALKQTIFGNESERDMAAFRSKLPDAYNDKESNSGDRSMWCGQPFEDSHEISNANQPRWSGHSATHDLVCLCTAGENGWPINGSDTLCGKGKDDLGGGSEGWGNKNRKAETQLKATWFNVTSECLQSDEKRGENLKDALDKFLRRLKHEPEEVNKNRYQLGEGTPGSYTACTGSFPYGVCVMYYNGTIVKKEHMPWWVDLQNALPEEEKFQEEKRRAEERRRQKEGEQRTDEPHTEALKSGHPTTEENEQHKTNNFTDKLRKLNLTSGTSISQPSSWLLRAILLI
ncbi:Variant surface glycoprotein [Trypanosoma congolense IL3000]|uniref:Variant surface glycoprotein n=1 Tax=Trypanosoma congolense (strain IL3000) TaxID=1068625 RepID=F9WEY6_TRYCI|nr:Variant surface glycoprotein [Trypanosoma congolense IL3000]